MKLGREFFRRDVLEVAPDLLGKYIILKKGKDTLAYRITEVEAYRGEEDLACHASKGRTLRTDVMYQDGGTIYVYLIYGIHYLLNFVTENMEVPQAVLIRGVEDVIGPGRVSKLLQIDKDFNREDLITSKRIWVEDRGDEKPKYSTAKRIGIDYAKEWKDKLWRFIISN